MSSVKHTKFEFQPTKPASPGDNLLTNEEIFYPNQFEDPFENKGVEFMIDFHDGEKTSAGKHYKLIHCPGQYIYAITPKYNEKKKSWKIINTLTLDIQNKALYSSSMSMTSNLTSHMTDSGIYKCVEYGFRHKVEIFLRTARLLLAGPDCTLEECNKIFNALQSRKEYPKYIKDLERPTEETKIAFLQHVINSIESAYASIKQHEGARMKELGSVIPYYMIEKEWNTNKTVYILSEFMDVHQPNALFMKFCAKWGVTFGEYVDWERAREWGSPEDISAFSSVNVLETPDAVETLTVDENGDIQGTEVSGGLSNGVRAAILRHKEDILKAKLLVDAAIADPKTMLTDKYEVPRNMFIHMYYMRRLQNLKDGESVETIRTELAALVAPAEPVKPASPKRLFSEI